MKNRLQLPFSIRLAALTALLLLPPSFVRAQNDAPSAAAAPATKLQIGPGDLIAVEFLRVPEMSQVVRVDETGDVSFHLIGSLHLAGLTIDEGKSLIAARYVAGNYLVNPQVSLLIEEYGTQGATVVGEVARPGVYPVIGRRSLLDTLSQAGGTTPAAKNEVTIERHADGSILTVALSRDARESLAADVEVLPGDKVIVPRAGIIYVLGDVYRPGGFVMQNDGKMTVLQAVAMAEGTQTTASLNSAVLIRNSPSGYVRVPVALKKMLQGKGRDSQMKAEDILYIPNSSMKSILYRGLPGVIASAAGAAIYRAPL